MRKNLLCFFFLFSLAIAGCKKENKTPADNQAVLTAKKSNVLPFEIATVSSDKISFQSESYTGSFNGMEVQLLRQENELFFFIPDIDAGTYKLSMTLEGKSYEVGYTVGALPVIADPQIFVTEKIQALQFSNQELATLENGIQHYPGAESISGQMEMIKTIYADMNNVLASSTPEEKLAAAKFITANPDLFAKPDLDLDYTGLDLFKPTTTDNVEAIVRDLDARIGRAVIIITAGAATTGLIAAYAPLHFKAVAALTGGATAALIYLVNSELIEATGNAIERFGNLIEQEMESQKTTSGKEFENKTTYSMVIASAYRNLNKQSLNTSSSVLKSILS